MPSTSTTKKLQLSILAHKPFRLFWLARVSSTIAIQMQGVAVGWQIYALTGSVFYLGLVGLAQFLPMFLLTLAVGHTADRYDRRRISAVCQIVEGLALASLRLAATAVGSARRRSSPLSSWSGLRAPSRGRPCRRWSRAWYRRS